MTSELCAEHAQVLKVEDVDACTNVLFVGAARTGIV